MATTGDRIRGAREAKGWTQDKLAERAGGISKGFLSDLENNKRDVSARYLLQIANALGLSMDFLLSGEAAEPKSRHEAVNIPASLSEAAEELKLSYAQTLTLLDARESMVFRRSLKATTAPTKEDWKKLHTAIKKLFPDE